MIPNVLIPVVTSPAHHVIIPSRLHTSAAVYRPGPGEHVFPFTFSIVAQAQSLCGWPWSLVFHTQAAVARVSAFAEQ